MPNRAPSSSRSAPLPRFLCALLVASLAACSSTPPRTYAPLSYDYLTPLRLNVETIEVDSRVFAAGSSDIGYLAPVPPVQALSTMAHDRLLAVGSTGRAVFVIKNASMIRSSAGIDATMDVELDVYGGGGTRAGFAEARVSRRKTGDIDDLRSTLYDMTKQMMDAMNIEFEYQVRRSLKDWLAPASAAPAPVQQQDLSAPGSTSAAPASSAPAAASLAPPPLAPPTAAPFSRPMPGSLLGGPQPTPLLPPRQP